jgi:phage gpG-like protein
LKGLKISKTNVEQTINLKEIFGTDFDGLKSLREAIGGAIIEKIRTRTAQGLGSNGRPLKSPYSAGYANSLDFKAAGKSRGNVNMKLSGDMLGLLDIKRQSSNEITIGWKDASQNPKAYNHQVGDTVPRRPFFGISKKELFEIKDQFQDEILEAIEMQKSGKSKEFEKKVEQLLNMIGASDVDAEEG